MKPQITDIASVLFCCLSGCLLASNAFSNPAIAQVIPLSTLADSEPVDADESDTDADNLAFSSVETEIYEDESGAGGCCGCCPAAAAAGCVCFDDWCGPWRLEMETFFWDRSAAGPTDLIRTTAAAAPSTVSLRGSDLSFSHDAGYRFSIYRQTNDCVAWEFNYADDDWDTTRTINGANNLLAVTGSTNYATADQIQASYRSEYSGFEINRHACVRGNLSWLMGFRMVCVDEVFNMRSTDNGNAQTSDYNIRTQNHLWGAQVGGMWHVWLLDRVQARVVGKTGLYGNNASQRVRMGDINNIVLRRDFFNRGGSTAMVSQLEVILDYELLPCWFVRVNYDMNWIQGLGLAPDQFQNDISNADAALRTNGDIFSHGFSIGVTTTF